MGKWEYRLPLGYTLCPLEPWHRVFRSTNGVMLSFRHYVDGTFIMYGIEN